MKNLLLFVLGFLLLTLCGCVEVNSDGDTTTYIMKRWIPLASVIGSVVTFAIAFILRKRFGVYAWGLMAFCFFLGSILGPNMFLDKVTVNPDGFSLNTGFWFYPTKHDVSFKDCKMIRLTAEERGESIDHYLSCEKGDGWAAKVPIGTVMDYAVQEILDRAVEQNIPVIDMSH